MRKLWPARSEAQAKVNAPVDADLDAIISEEVTFRFKGKIHKIKPISLAEFFKWSNGHIGLMMALKEEKPLSPADLAQKYHVVISAVCDTITVEDIEKMEQAQLAALYQLVTDKITGTVDVGEGGEKKKRLRLDLYNFAAPSSSPSSAPPSGGQAK